MIDDLSRQLQERVLASLTAAEKWDLNEKQAREVLSWNPGYAVEYLKRSFRSKQALKRTEAGIDK